MPIEDETEQLRRFSTHPACQNGGSSRVRIHIQTEGPPATCSAGLSLFISTEFAKPASPCSTICNLRQIFRHLHEIAIQIGIDKKALLHSRQHHFSLADNNRRRSCQVR